MTNYFVNKLNKERGVVHVAASKNHTFESAQDKYIGENGHHVHKLKAKDSTDRWAYYFVLVSSAKEAVFLKALNNDRTIDLEKYGQVIASNYGEKPNAEVLNLLRKKYGWKLDQPGEDSDGKK